MDEIEFGDFDCDSDLERQRALFRTCFPENEGTPVTGEKHYYWKFHSFPSEHRSYEFEARRGTDLVGYYAALPYRYSIGGRHVTAGMVCDVMTDPELRGQGVFTRIGRHATEELRSRGVHFCTGYPIRPEVMPGHLKVGWKKAFRLPIHVHVLSGRCALESRGLGLLAPAVDALVRTTNAVVGLPGRLAQNRRLTVEVTDASQLGDLPGYDEFFEAWARGQKHHLVKDRDFLEWRLGAPETRYEIVTLRDARRIVALAITRATVHEGVSTLALLDVMALPELGREIAGLWAGIKQLARERRVDTVTGIFSATWARRYHLLENAFFPTPFVITLIVKTLDGTIVESEFLREENWHLSWIDSDDG